MNAAPKKPSDSEKDQQRPFLCFTEFERGGYDQADIIRAISDLLRDVAQEHLRHDACIDRFNRSFLEYTQLDRLRDELIAIEERIGWLFEVDNLDSSESLEVIDVKKYSLALVRQCKRLISALRSKRNLYQEQAADSYLNAYYELARQSVFSPENYNLSSPSFRKSKFLKDLLSFAAREMTVEEKEGSPAKKYYSYCLLDPFAYDTIQRALACAIALRQSYVKSKEGDLLRNLRYSLLLDSIQSAFRRFVSLDNNTYRIELNRHDSSLLATSYDDLSSIEAIKPIRLFEKIASYIRKNLCRTNTSKYRVNVCIIGHTETSQNEERELKDLVSAVLNWYSDLTIDKPALDFRILNIVNRFCGPGSYRGVRRSGFSLRLSVHNAQCEIEEVAYSRDFEFSTKRMQSIIRKNQVVFVLDCPFLTTENFEIKQIGSLDSFCLMLRDRERNWPPATLNLDTDSQYFYKHSAMQGLDSQFNRVMSSTTQNAGEIIRVVKDQLLMNIEKIIASYSGDSIRRCFYIFTSEKDGIDYSYIASHPLTRCERYDGKNFTIISFCNHKLEMMRCNEDGDVQFNIRLWSVLKYTSVSYAYMYFKDRITECLGAADDAKIDYFTIYRNILICGKVDQRLRNVSLELRLGDGLDACLQGLNNDRSIDEMKRELLELAAELIVPIYKNCVFSDNKAYGNDAIRTAFMMNLYSSSKDVNTMLFWHKYRVACANHSCGDFHVTFANCVNTEPLQMKNDEFEGGGFLMDRKIYDVMLDTLEHTSQFSIGMRVMLHNARSLFSNTRIIQTVIDNIKRACVQADITDSEMYRNACAALRNFEV